MKKTLLDLLTCPNCHNDELTLNIQQLDGDEIIAGTVSCCCGNAYSVSRGILRTVATDTYVDNFSFEWQLHRKTQLDSEENRRSTTVFGEKTELNPRDFAGRQVLDVGVGTGRFADVLARAGANVTGIDLSFAVETAMENVGHMPGCNIVQADVFDLPFRPESFDLIYSIGVLHHTPDCKKAFQGLLPFLRPGGTIVIWVYDAHTWIPGSLLETVNSAWRAVTTRLPNRVLYALCIAELPLYFLRKIPGMDRLLHLVLPGVVYHAIPKFNDHSDIKEHILDNFDWYSPKYQSKHSYPEVFSWFEEAGLSGIRILAAPVAVSGSKPTRSSRKSSGRRESSVEGIAVPTAHQQ